MSQQSQDQQVDEKVSNVNLDSLDPEYEKAISDLREKAGEDPEISWGTAIEIFSNLEESRGYMGGCALPDHSLPLLLEPKHPHYELFHGKIISEEGDLVSPPEDDLDHIEHLRAYARCQRETGRYSSDLESSAKLHMLFNTLSMVPRWPLKAELKAMRKLQELISEHQFHCYVTVGAFIETSKRSGVAYLFRKTKPTIAMRSGPAGGKWLCALCLHPSGLYYQSNAGVLCPTDDVIAHLVMMRGDERRYWSRANQHDLASIEAGV